MSLNSTPSANRLHIGFFGKRNVGKSSVVNAITGQNLSIVSDVKGTTTDPVSKAMELLPLGPVVIIDTPGIDDEGIIGEMRVKKSKQILNKTDIAILVTDTLVGLSEQDNQLINLFKEKSIPYIVVYNKCDLSEKRHLLKNEISVSATEKTNIHQLKELIASFAKNKVSHKRIIGDLLTCEDTVILVTPIDESAPKGRMILPQMQVIRDILDSHATCIVTQPEQLNKTLKNLNNPPKMVVTDSQAFTYVKNIVPKEILLTSFSVLFAHYKGILETAVIGAAYIKNLNENDNILISEGCTHHRQCNDIGTVKLPNWIEKFTGKTFNFHFTSGGEFPEDLSNYKLIVHCGGCMLNEREMKYRLKSSVNAKIAFTNYGTLIAYMNGILRRSIQVFPAIMETIDI